MGVHCHKCGKAVNTLSKRRHRCRKVRPKKVVVNSRSQSFLIQPKVVYWSAERCEKALEVLKSWSTTAKDYQSSLTVERRRR